MSENNTSQEQIQDLLFKREIGWQEIIYDLINTEQLDPWDINITLLSDKYLAKIREIEEADFFISSQVLLAASLLLKIKTEILLNKYIKSIDEILFGKKEKQHYQIEKIELEEEIPELFPKTPLPRFKRVTLQELMQSLNKAIKTENRRIKKEIIKKNTIMESSFSISKKKINIRDKIKQIYSQLFNHFKKNKDAKKISLSEFVGENKEEKVISFSSLLHLENQKKIWLDQEKHFDEIYIWLKEIYLKHNPDPFADLKQELNEKVKDMNKEEKKRLEKIEKDFSNPIGE